MMSTGVFPILMTGAFAGFVTLLCVVLWLRKMWNAQRELLRSQHRQLTTYIEAREEERRKIAADLHTELGGLVSSSLLLLQLVRDENAVSGESRQHLWRSIDLLKAAVKETRRITELLAPPALAKFGLPTAIDDLKQKYSGRLSIDLTNHCPTDLPELVQLNLYHMIDELFCSTVARGNSAIRLHISKTADQVVLNYHEQGHSAGTPSGTITQKVALLRGEMDVVNDNGTQFNFRFNLN